MKRKLDENDVPSFQPESKRPSIKKVDQKAPDADAELSFVDMGLDPRLLQAVAEQGFHHPTLVQRKAIPLAFKGQDVLCKAKTGSGKTAAYVLPVLSGVLKIKNVRLGPR